MQTTIENIVFELLNSNHFKDKLLGSELAKVFTKERKDPKKIEIIRNKLYSYYLSMLHPLVINDVKTYDSIIKGLSELISKSSGYQIDNHGNFHRGSKTINHTNEGYIIEDEESLRFFEKFESELKVIHNSLTKRNTILNNPANYDTNSNQKLIELLKEFFSVEQIELINTKKLYK